MKYFFIILLFLISACKFYEEPLPYIEMPNDELIEINIKSLEQNLNYTHLDTNIINLQQARYHYFSWKNKYNDFPFVFCVLKLMKKEQFQTFDQNTLYKQIVIDTNNLQLKFVLYATLKRGNTIEWELQQFVNNSTKYFTMLYGNSNINSDWGYFILYNKLNNNNNLRLQWSLSDTAKLQIISDIDSLENDLSYIKITQKNDKNLYDFNIEVWNYTKRNKVFIQVSEAEIKGRIIDSAYFKNNNWHYWSLASNNTIK